MSAAFRFDPVELPPECDALPAEVREFIAGELATGLWAPNSDFQALWPTSMIRAAMSRAA